MASLKTKSILRDLPVPIQTARLALRPTQPGDGLAMNRLITATFKQLHEWMDWAQKMPTVEDSEEFARYSYARWLLREELNLVILRKDDQALLGATGFHSIDWRVPKFEIGYWLGARFQGQGYASEAVAALTQYAFQVLGARRLEIRMDERNIRSKTVAERLGYRAESRMVNHVPSSRSPAELRTTLVYVRFDLDGLP